MTFRFKCLSLTLFVSISAGCWGIRALLLGSLERGRRILGPCTRVVSELLSFFFWVQKRTNERSSEEGTEGTMVEPCLETELSALGFPYSSFERGSA